MYHQNFLFNIFTIQYILNVIEKGKLYPNAYNVTKSFYFPDKVVGVITSYFAVIVLLIVIVQK